jgi:hypothetical protein
LHHKNGWVLQVRDVTFRPPYCTLIARVVNGEEKELHFNTEAFANGVFVSIEVEAESEETIEEVSVGMQKSPLVGIEFSPPIIDREIADGRESSGGRGRDRRTG